MSADGPTTVGSIVGKLRMDRAEWTAAVAATKAEIRDLEGSDPDIHIDTNAAQAIAELGATAAAADALGAKQEELGRRTKRTTDETIRANEANKTSFSRIGAIVTAVALLAPLLAPVGAAAIGVGSAFLGMGAAGVLAIIGIHHAMREGTALGGAYRDGIDDLKGSMNQLASTAAVAMLSSFRRVVAETRQELPMLNQQVGQFSTLLGRSGANVFSGVINSLRVLNPLFLTAGLYIETLTAGFRRWTESEGIERFGNYALGMLPRVTEILGKLTSMVMHLLQAMAPLGAIGLLALGGIADAINAIPVDVLSQMIVTVTWGAIAFKAWGFVAPMLATIAQNMGMVTAATTIAKGPIGWYVAGLAALAGIFAVVIANSNKAAQASSSYTAAVEADNGVIKENIRLTAIKQLQDAGAYDLAKKYGITVQDVTDAVLGEAGARERLNGKIAEQRDLLTKVEGGGRDAQASALRHSQALEQLTGLVNTNSGAIAGEILQYNERTSAFEGSIKVTRAQQEADEALAAALGVSVGVLQEARNGQQGVEESTAKATAEMYLQGDAAGLLRQQLDLLNGKALSAAEAQNRFESQLVGMVDAVKNNGTALYGMTEGAIANRGSLLDLIQSSEATVVALRDQGASQDAIKAKFEEGRQAIIDSAVAQGMNREEVTKFIEELYKVPATIPPIPAEVDAAAAEATLERLARTRNVLLNVVTAYPNGRPLSDEQIANQYGFGGGANGMTVRGMSGGGSVIGRGTAGSDTAGLFRLAHGEEVISNRFGQADRNRSLLKAINAGFTPSQSSAGTARASSSSFPEPVSAAAARQVVVEQHFHVETLQNEDPVILGNIIGRQAKTALVGVNL